MVKSKASKRSRKSNRSNASQCADEIVQCPHLHFKSDVIDRNVLSKEQHLNLLSTPKGYRWEEPSDKKEGGQGEGTENLPTNIPRRIVCSGRRMRKPEKVYVHNFLAEVWTFLTPEMIDRLKGMLMNEFGMSPQEANKFLRDQEKMAASTHKKSSKTLRKENKCYDDTPMVIKNYMQKQFADIMSVELEEIIVSLICGPRSKSMVEIAERLLDQLAELTGEKCTLQTPQNGTQNIMVFVADQTAVWLNDVVEESDETMVDKREKKLRGIEEGGKGDAGDDQDDIDEDVTIIKKKKRPSGMSLPSQAGDGDAAAKKGGADKPASTPSRPSKSKQSGDETGKDEAKGQTTKRQSAKPKGDEKADTSKGDGDRKSVASKPKSKPATREGSKQGGAETKGSSDARGGSRAQAGASGKTSGRASTSKPSSRPVEKKSIDKGPSSTGGRGTTRPSTSKDQGKGSQDGVKKGSSDTGKSPRGSQVPPQRPKTASEVRRDKIAEIVSTHLSQMITETDKKSTPRQEALQDVISKQLEDKVGPRDSTTIDAIAETSALLATYIDKVTGNVEQEYGNKTPVEARVPVAQRGKGPVFSVRKQPSDYLIRHINHTEAKAKVYKSRGLPTPGAISLTEGAFKPNETKEWANWANEVANMADRWSKWIDSTVSDAMKAAEKRKAAGLASAPSTSSWRDWKDTAGAEALEWRRNKKLLDTQARLFSDKAESSMKPKSAPPPGTTKNQPKNNSP